MKSFSSRELVKMVKMVEADGWEHTDTTGSHHHFRHPTKPGRVTIPHPKKDLPIGTVKSILQQAKIKL